MIIFSDLHLEPKSEEAALEVLRRIPEVAAKHGESTVAFLGDFWMIRHSINVRLLLEAQEIIDGWFPQVRTTYVLPGNHDHIDRSGRNAMEVFDHVRGVQVLTEPAWTLDGLWVPYLYSEEDLRAALAMEKINDRCANVCFAHAALRGAMMNNLHANEDGVESGIFKEYGFKRVFLGHYHLHQVVRKGVMYVGSPYQVSYAEAGQPKGYVHWDGKKATFHEWDPPIGKRHFKVVVDADHPEPFHLNGEMREGDKLWVLVKGSMAGTMRDVVSDQLQKAGVEVERLEVDMQPTTDRARLKRTGAETMQDLAFSYVDAQDMEDDFKAMLRGAWEKIS